MLWTPFRHMRMGACLMVGGLIAVSVSRGAESLGENGGAGVFRLQSAVLPDETTLGLGLYNRLLNTDSKYFSSLIENNVVKMADSSQAEEPAHLWALSHVFAASLSTDRMFEAHLTIPVYTEFLNWELGHIGAIAIGDMRYGLKLALPMRDRFPVAAALLFEGSIPTAQLGLPVPMRMEYVPESPSAITSKSHAIGTEHNEWNLGAAASLDLRQTPIAWPTLVHFNLGERRTGPLFKGDGNYFDVFYTGLGFEERLTPVVSLAGEYWHENRIQIWAGDPVLNDLSLGVTLNTAMGLSYLLGAAVALDNESTTYEFYDQFDEHKFDFGLRSSPQAQIILAVTYTLGFKNKIVDSDGDGVPDNVDDCPTVPQGPNGKDGCPNPDSDNDGICDPWVMANGLGTQFASVCQGTDQCPFLPEGENGKDGCPSPDQDSDGVCDPWVAQAGLSRQYASICVGVDKCPTVPQGLNGKGGCPIPDRDGDGVPDSLDKCPDEKGPYWNNGCPPLQAPPQAPPPETAPVQQKTLILKGVSFESGKAVLLPSSYPSLNDLGNQLVSFPDIKLEVAGYTDDHGNPAVNLKLSRARAQAVATYLIKGGVSADRLKAVGYGSSKPIATNHTAEGRAENRRVEFHRLQ